MMSSIRRPARMAVPAAVLALLALLAPGLATASSAGDGGTGATVLFEDFNDGDAAGWTEYNRYFSVVKGRYVVSGGYRPKPCGRDGWSVTHAGDTSWDDYVLKAQIRMQPSPWSQGELLFRVGAQTSPSCLPVGYRLSVWGEYDPGVPRLGLMRYDATGGVLLASVIGAKESNIWSTTDMVDVKVRVNGPRIRVWIGDQEVISVVDPAPLRSGGVGVMGIWEATPSFDNIRVRLLEDGVIVPAVAQ